MSKLITNTIRHTGGSADNITLDNSQNVTVEGNLTVDGTTTISGYHPTTSRSNRNLIINGAMQISQRGDSTGVTSATFNGPDRWLTNVGSCGTWSISQSTDSPDEFSKSLKWDCTTADASPAAGDVCFIESKYEGQDLQHLKWGTAGAQSLTLSFWIKCTKTGNIAVCFWNLTSQRMITKTATISSANTWEKKTITIPGDTGGSGFTNDNHGRFQLEFWFDGGSNFQGGSSVDSWGGENNNRRGAGETLALADNTSNDLYITGIQLEVGDTATDFEHRSYGDELAKCQRYYYMHADAADDPVCNGHQYQQNNFFGTIHFPVRMRTPPTIDLTTSGTGNFGVYSNGYTTLNSAQLQQESDMAYVINIYGGGNQGSGDVGKAAWIILNGSDGKICFKAEL